MDLRDFSDATISLGDLLKRQDDLEAAAAEVVGFNIDECTHDRGPLTQPIYSCLTCQRANGGEKAGVCAACSVQCHGDHELVELLHRRGFTCDCGTVALGSEAVCKLGKRLAQDRNSDNRYDHNFLGEFCVCRQQYDPEQETSDMYQCVVCEDWLHRSCVLPSAFTMSDDDWDGFICSACTTGAAAPVLSRWAGAPGTGVMVVEEDGSVRGALPRSVLKRAASTSPAPEAKRVKLDEVVTSSSPPTTATTAVTESVPTPTTAATATSSQDALEVKPSISAAQCIAPPPPPVPARGPVLLEEGWRERWCRCPACLPLFADLPFLLEADEAWEPEEDPQAKRSLLELGTEALNQLPREVAINGLHRYNEMRDKLLVFLKPLADSGASITKADIERFFEEQKH